MSVEIKELIVKGRVSGSTEIKEADVVKLIEEYSNSSSSPQSINDRQKNKIIEECVTEVIERLENIMER